MTKRLALYLALSLLAIAVYLPGVTPSLLADDWPLVTRNVDLSPDEALARFQSPYAGWYRPLFDLYLHAGARAFVLQARGYHVAALLLYLGLTLAVGLLAESLTGERTMGLLASLFFGVHSVHAEPALWIAASNELLAGVFVLGALACYSAFRRRRRRAIWYAGAGVCFLGALAAKETAVFLPILLGAYDLWLYAPRAGGFRWRMLLPVTPFLLVQAGFLAFRVVTGSPYTAVPSLGRVAANVAYYGAVGILSLPDDYGCLGSLALWERSPVPPLLAVAASAAALILVLGLFRKFAGGKQPFRQQNALRFSLTWTLVALLPVLLTATGRTAFMSSIGVAWTLAILFGVAWQQVRARPARARFLFGAALALFLAANLGVATYRTYWWRQASATMEQVVEQVDAVLEEIPPGTPICLVGLPDHLRYAYLFRNAFPALQEARYPAQRITAILDTCPPAEVPGSATACGEGAVILQYTGGRLRSSQVP